MNQKHDTYLSDAEPTHEDQKTIAQINDTKRPSSMRESSDIYDAANDDETPAIERIASHKNPTFSRGSSKLQFQIDEKFAKEIKERQRQEEAARKQRELERKNAAEMQKNIEQQEAQKKINEGNLTLDTAQKQRDIANETYQKNLNKIYPDPKPEFNEVDNQIFRNNQKTGAQSTQTGIVHANNEELQKAIYVALLFNIFAIAEFIIYLIFKTIPTTTHYIIFYAAITIAGVLLIYSAHKCQDKTVPDGQSGLFTLAATMPGLLLISFVSDIVNFISSPISNLGPLAMLFEYLIIITGTILGSSLYYTILERYKVKVSYRTPILISIVYALYTLIPLILQRNENSTSLYSLDALGQAIAIAMALIQVGIFIYGHFRAYRASLKTT